MAAISYQFLPWVRNGLAVALGTADTLGTGAVLPARASAPVGVRLAGEHAGAVLPPLQVQLYGPGDVIGIDPAQVIRTDPKPESRSFEPNYLALVDFDAPDLPWLLTPAKANLQDRLRPWLVLLVLDRAKVAAPRLSAPAVLPSVRIPAAAVASELPDLMESWAWCHTQLVSKADDPAGLAADLQALPDSNVARLVCPRRLEAQHDYIACVVPAFEPGRLRGLGLAEAHAEAMNSLAPAWTPGAVGDVVLPVYFHWEFSTSAAGDFESLARRLRTPADYQDTPLAATLAQVGTVPMRVDPLLTGLAPAPSATMEGVLVPVSYAMGSKAPLVQMQSLAAIVNTPAARVVNPVGDGALDADGKRLEVKAPMVGGWHAKKHSVAVNESHWLAGLNLNPRYRGGAGYGAEIVRRHQEPFMDACWDQVGNLLEAEAQFNYTRLAIEVQRGMKARWLDPLRPERALQVYGPALERIEARPPTGSPYRIHGEPASIGGQLERSSLPGALADVSMRRLVSPQRRALRLAARLGQGVAILPAMARAHVVQMAAASQRSAAFRVNDFMPDGLVGSRAFDGLRLSGPDSMVLDLSALGLGKGYTVGQVRRLRASRAELSARLSRSGPPVRGIRPGQSRGVVTDVHVARFGDLAEHDVGMAGSDWALVAQQVEALGGRGIEGMLVETSARVGTGTALRFSTLRLDARSGSLKMDRVLRAVGSQRQDLGAAAASAAFGRAVPGITLATVPVADARRYSTAGMIAALPPGALSAARQDGQPAAAYVLDANFELAARAGPASGAGGSSITMPPANRQRAVLARYAEAVRGQQQQGRDGHVQARVQRMEIDFSLAVAAATLKLRSAPDSTLPARLASMVQIAQAAVGKGGNPFTSTCLSADASATHRYMVPALFDRVMAWPHLPVPLYKLLEKIDRNAFMPGVDGLPPDLVMLMKVNQAMVDSVMAGANVEMNRELLWRGFPTDLRGTPFQRFWGRVDARLPGPVIELDDIAPMHLWGAQGLGLRPDPGGSDPDRVVLLVRGQLLRRYPNTAVYAWKRDKTAPGNKLLRVAGVPPDGAIQTPVLSGTVGEDISFFGFEIDAAEARTDWCFVLEQQMTEPRFGFDVDEAPANVQDGGAAQGAVNAGAARRQVLTQRLALVQQAPAGQPVRYNAYKALAWGHIGVAPGGFTTVAQVRDLSAKPFDDFPTLGPEPSAADIARALLQQPFRAYFLGSQIAT